MTAAPSRLVRLLAEADQLAAELKRREAVRLRAEAVRNLSAFVRLMWRVVEPAALEWGWHMEAICNALQDVTAGRTRRLVINVPPGFSKSLLTSVFYPAWKWLRNPSDRTLYLSHDAELARRDSRRTRILLQSPEYQELLKEAGGRWKFARDQNETLNFENTERGFRYCASLGSGLTGKRGDNIVIDDPHDVKDAIEGDVGRIAERLTEQAANFDQVVQSRLNDQRTGSIVIIMQRVHEVDLTGHVLSGTEPYTTLILPMRYDPERADPADPRTEPGELLDPVRFPAEVVARLESRLGHQASGQLQQRPVAKGGGMFPPDGWMWLDRSAFPTKYQREAMGWDLAFGASDGGAYHVGIHGGLLNGRIYHGGEVRLRAEVSELMEAMRGARARWPLATGWYVEKRAAAATVLNLLRSEIPGMVPKEPDGDKVARAQVWQPSHAAGSLVLPCRCGVTELHRHPNLTTCPGEPWAVDFAREHEGFPRAQFKDRVDAEGYLVRELLGRSGSVSFGVTTG